MGEDYVEECLQEIKEMIEINKKAASWKEIFFTKSKTLKLMLTVGWGVTVLS